MIKSSSLRYIFPIGLLIAFFLDGSLSYNFTTVLYRSYSMVPYLSLLWLFLTLFFVGLNGYNLHLYWWAAILGALFDWYYVGILGVLVFIFPLIIYISKLLYYYLPTNFLSGLFIYFIDLSVLQWLGFFANHLISRISGDVSLAGLNFLIHDFIPTVLLNLIIFIVLYYPIQFLYNNCQRCE